jgi:predicted regulator of Ras-like GTPase activity (Roadblock/LC7/MglB family)
MAVSSSVDPERPDAVRRSIRSSFAVRVAVPAACLAVLWVLGMAAAFRTAMTGRTLAHSHAILVEYGLLAVAGLVAIAVTVALTASFGRGLSRDVARLATAAELLAGPAPGAPAGRRADAAVLAAEAGTAEVARAATAIASLRQHAAAATASESGLRDGLRQVFVSLAKRNQSLLQRQLRLIDTLEQKASDPADQFRQAVILSRDGLVIAASKELSREDAEHMAALAAGLQSLARGAGEHYGVGAVRQCVIELEQALLFVTSAGHGSCLAVLCPADADAGLVAYEMAMLVKRAGPHLAARPRFRTIHSPAG